MLPKEQNELLIIFQANINNSTKISDGHLYFGYFELTLKLIKNVIYLYIRLDTCMSSYQNTKKSL